MKDQPISNDLRLENKLKQRKERLLMFTKALMKHLEQNDSGMHVCAKNTIHECLERNDNQEPDCLNFMDSLMQRLHGSIGDRHWNNAVDRFSRLLKMQQGARDHNKSLNEAKNPSLSATTDRSQGETLAVAAMKKEIKSLRGELDALHRRTNVVQRMVGKMLAAEEDFRSKTLEGKKLVSNCTAFAKTTKKRKKGNVKSFLATHVATNNNKTLRQRMKRIQLVLGKMLAKEEDRRRKTWEDKKRPLEDAIQLLEKQLSLDSNCASFAKSIKKRKKENVKSLFPTHVVKNKKVKFSLV